MAVPRRVVPCHTLMAAPFQPSPYTSPQAIVTAHCVAPSGHWALEFLGCPMKKDSIIASKVILVFIVCFLVVLFYAINYRNNAIRSNYIS